MLYIFITSLILFLIIYLSFSKKDSTHKSRQIDEIIESPFISYQQIKHDVNKGNCKLKINNNYIKPFMFKNISNKSISNENIIWNLECIDSNKNLYQIKLNSHNENGLTQHCMYIDGNDVCLYDLDSSPIETKKDTKSCKQLCSIDSIFNNNLEFDKNKSLFYLETIDNNNYYIKNFDNQYLCNSNNKIILSSNKTDKCIWNL